MNAVIDEFDLPCAECGDDLVRTVVADPESGRDVTVAECPNCGGRYYPTDALERL